MSDASVNLTVWQRLHAVDAALLVRVQGLRSPLLTRLMRTLTRLGDAESWLAMGGALAALPAGRPAALDLGVAAALATGVVQLLKRTCRRRRPDSGIAGFRALMENPDRFSFPSGHTATAVAVAAAAHGALGPVLLALAAGIAVSRVYLGAHYPLDIAVGAAVGTAAGLAAPLLM